MKIKFAILGLTLCAAVLAVLAIASCAALSPGADALVVRVEQTETTAKATFDAVLNEDNANRPFWKTNAPAFHNFCEWLRAPQVVEATNTLPRASAMLLSMDDVKVAYQASRTAGNSNTLYSVFMVVDAALTQANSWLTIATNAPAK